MTIASDTSNVLHNEIGNHLGLHFKVGSCWGGVCVELLISPISWGALIQWRLLSMSDVAFCKMLLPFLAEPWMTPSKHF